MMYAPDYGNEDFMYTRRPGLTLQPLGHLPEGYRARNASQAINALTESLYRVARECCDIYGAGPSTVLANLLGSVSYAAASNSRTGDGKGRSNPLTLFIHHAAEPLSGKSTTFDRLSDPIVKATKGSKACRSFDDITLPALRRKLRAGAVLSRLGTAEALGYFKSQLSHTYAPLNELHDGKVPPLDRADDDENISVDAPDTAIFVICVNVQVEAYRRWLAKHADDAIASGYLFRVLITETGELANEGSGGQQPEVALVDYDKRIGQLIASARANLETMSVSQLPVLEAEAEAEKILRDSIEHFEYMASVALPGRNALVFAVRLIANARRIAGCMHVFEGYEGLVSVETARRALTIAEYFGAQWLATVFPPKPLPEAMLRAQRLLDFLYERRYQNYRQSGSWRKAELQKMAPNFGWTPAQMNEAIRWICGQKLAQVVTRIENGRSVDMLELIMHSLPYQLDHRNEPLRIR